MLTINESIDRLCEMVDQMSEGYQCNLEHGGSGDLDYELDMEAIQNVVRECQYRGDALKAAIEDLRKHGGCNVCKFGDGRFTLVCADCDAGNYKWMWRGITKRTLELMETLDKPKKEG